MKSHLIDMFGFNLDANRKMVLSVQDIPGNGEMLKLLSHLANCQYKWLERIIDLPEAAELGWWEPLHAPDELIFRFEEGTQRWIDFLQGMDDHQLEKVIQYKRGVSAIAEVKVKDIALQLIFHSFHHRAQIQMMIREKGITPGFIDYLGARVNIKGEN
jgi:uncharacterized damage-inducible protein DinB